MSDRHPTHYNLRIAAGPGDGAHEPELDEVTQHWAENDEVACFAIGGRGLPDR